MCSEPGLPHRVLYATLILTALLGLTGCAGTPGGLARGGFAGFGTPAGSSEANPPMPNGARESLSAETAGVNADGALAAEPRARESDAAHATLATGDNSLWDRLRKGMRLDTSYSNPRIDMQRRWFQNHPDYVERVFLRAEPFMHHLVQEAEARRLPMELILLPVVESAFDPFAYSQAHASGIWQFIPGTARRFGLEQNWWYDGRRDVIASTNAALDYLATLNRMFDGDWLHALASYNAGEGSVQKAIRRNRKAGLSESFWTLKLPRETTDYVPRLLALAQIVADPARYQMRLPYIPDAPRIAVLELDGQLDLHQAASLAGLDIEDIYRLNPGYNRWSTAPQGPHRLVLPVALEESFQTAYAALPAGEHVHWVRHRVMAGDSLPRLAERYHTTVELIRETNDLPNNRIRQGSRLLIPTARVPLDRYTLSASNRLLARQHTAPARAAGARFEHRVQSGETLWEIAQRYGVSSAQVARWNAMAQGDLLPAGATLVVWRKGNEAAPSVAGSGVFRKVGYRIKPGDSLSSIAARFNVSVRDLVKWNTLRADTVLHPGRTLRVLVDVTAGHETET